MLIEKTLLTIFPELQGSEMIIAMTRPKKVNSLTVVF
jgi:hypothetical protein